MPRQPSSTRPTTHAWVQVAHPSPRIRLVCLPYAGGGANIFRTWATGLPPDVDVCPVRLPGRESRFAEPPFTHITPLIHALAAALRPHLDVPFALFGHSMGALVSFELARHLRRIAAPQPVLLVVAGNGAPHLPRRMPIIHHLPRAEFIAGLRRYGGTPPSILDNQEILDVFLPMLRADLTVTETYRYTPDTPLACPIVAYVGRHDPVALPDDMAAWSSHTGSTFTLRELPGAHFFLHTAQDMLLALLRQDLQRVMDAHAAERHP